METSKKLPEKLQEALHHDALHRIPLTFLPFINQQLREWEFLFPNERTATGTLVVYIDSLSPTEAATLFSDVVRLEDKMGAHRWHQFSTEEQTIENSSELARSPYFQNWRHAVQAVFDEADRHAMQAQGGSIKPRNRAIVLDIPASLPVEQTGAWRHWHGMGKCAKLKPAESQLSQSVLDSALNTLISEATKASESSDSDRDTAASSSADSWVIDGARSLVDAFLANRPFASSAPAILLSNARLETFRENFSREINTMRKNLTDADSVYDHLRKIDVAPWCPHEVATDPAVREFVRSLYLSGNGAVIFGNSFVEWAASEALRRARPHFLAARFGLRSKPKPFTGVAVFDDPNQVNPLPAIDDLSGSAIDAEILAAYIWLSAIRYPEFRQSTVCICFAGSLAEAYVVAPPEFNLKDERGPISMEAVTDSLKSWLL